MANYQETHRKIVESAKECFLEKGYERSNLREICKRAGVTTGAFYRHFSDKISVFELLVQPALDECKKYYDETEADYYALLNDEDLKKVWDLQEEFVEVFIDIIYKHYDAFKLLLEAADGTSYSDFVHQCAIKETSSMIDYIDEIQKRGFYVADVSSEEYHMLIQAYFSSLFEVVMHDYSKEKALKYSKTLADFYRVGWKNLFKF